MQILMYIGVGLLGILLYTTFKARSYVMKPEFDWNILWCDNKKAWMWSLIMLILLAIIVVILPKSGDAIKVMIGLDTVEEITSWLSLGFALSALARNTMDN